MTKKSRQQLNIELADAHVFDRLSQVSDNLGISKRDIVEELIMDFLERVKKESPLLLVESDDPVDRIEALMAYRKAREPNMIAEEM
jgi:hypothetical protein|tara:strand:- start:62 stop:319 length:258 start_codon:yes stop_codon:yes gene_type:complete